MEVTITRREALACKILSHMQYDKPGPEGKFYDNFFNRTLWWICKKILKVDVLDLIEKTVQFMNGAKVIYK